MIMIYVGFCRYNADICHEFCGYDDDNCDVFDDDSLQQYRNPKRNCSVGPSARAIVVLCLTVFYYSNKAIPIATAPLDPALALSLLCMTKIYYSTTAIPSATVTLPFSRRVSAAAILAKENVGAGSRMQTSSFVGLQLHHP